MSNKQGRPAEIGVAAGPPPLAPTGVSGLDEVLGGGLPIGSLVIVLGPPGSGKTTLANQLAFAAVRGGQRALVLTALSESTSKLIAHLRSFTFFEDDLVGDSLQYLSLQQFLTEGLDAGSASLISMVRRAKADLVVLDGFRGVRGVDMNPQAARQFLYDIGSSLSIVGKMSIVTSEADPRDPLFFPEATTADVILGLHYGVAGVRQRRKLEVIKMRGAAPLPGLHGIALTPAGVGVYPRLEARISAESQAAREAELPIADVPTWATGEAGASAPSEQLSIGIGELNDLLGGGLTRGTAMLVAGNLGTGKTLLALHFALEGVARGEPTLFFGFRESRDQLLLKADSFDLGHRLRQALAPGGLLHFVRYAPIELNPDIVAHELFGELDRLGARRLVIDSIAELEHMVAGNTDPARLDNYLTALVEGLRLRGITSVFVKEIRQAVGIVPEFREETVSVVAGNVLLLQQVEQQGKLRRVCSVLKTRFSAHDATLHEFVIQAPEGLRVLGPFQSGTGTLTGFSPGVSDAGQPPTGG